METSQHNRLISSHHTPYIALVITHPFSHHTTSQSSNLTSVITHFISLIMHLISSHPSLVITHTPLKLRHLISLTTLSHHILPHFTLLQQLITTNTSLHTQEETCPGRCANKDPDFKYMCVSHYYFLFLVLC